MVRIGLIFLSFFITNCFGEDDKTNKEAALQETTNQGVNEHATKEGNNKGNVKDQKLETNINHQPRPQSQKINTIKGQEAPPLNQHSTVQPDNSPTQPVISSRQSSPPPSPPIDPHEISRGKFNQTQKNKLGTSALEWIVKNFSAPQVDGLSGWSEHNLEVIKNCLPEIISIPDWLLGTLGGIKAKYLKQIIDKRALSCLYNNHGLDGPQSVGLVFQLIGDIERDTGTELLNFLTKEDIQAIFQDSANKVMAYAFTLSVNTPIIILMKLPSYWLHSITGKWRVLLECDEVLIGKIAKCTPTELTGKSTKMEFEALFRSKP